MPWWARLVTARAPAPSPKRTITTTGAPYWQDARSQTSAGVYEPGDRSTLYINPDTDVGMEGMPQDEADSLLDELLAHMVRPENIYEHDWRTGDLVLWDNAVALHARDAFPNDKNRLVKRMIIKLDPAQHIIPPVAA